MRRSDRIGLFASQDRIGQVLLEPDSAHDRLDHAHYTRLCSMFGREAYSLDAGDGICIIAVGSGLMMSTIDTVRLSGVKAHCAVDIGGLNIRQMGQITEWGCLVSGHTAVLLCTWHSLSSAGQFGKHLACYYPDMVARRTPAHLYPCIKGLDECEIPHEVGNFESITLALDEMKHAR